MTNDEIRKFVSKLINNSDERIHWYDNQLKQIYKEKDLYPDWYKDFLREMKNTESGWMKNLQKESYWLKIE